MIPDIRIENLQSHVDTYVEFHPGVNAVTGITDSGKSGLIRAMKYAALNKPSGDSLRRHHTKKTSITMKGVQKVRTSSKHYYKMGEDTYKALRTDVPIPIQDALRLSSVNFQEQHDAYFLIGKSPGEVARTLNEVVDLQVIDLSLKEIKLRVRDSKTQRINLTQKRADQEQVIRDLDWVEEADVEYAVIEKLRERISELESESATLETAIREAKRLSDEAAGYPSTVLDLRKISRVETELVVESPLPAAIKNAEESQVNIPDATTDIAKVQSCVEKLSVNFDELETAIISCTNARAIANSYPVVIDDPSGALSKLNAATDALLEIEEAVQEALISEDCLDFAESSYEVAKIELDEKMKELKVCPLCGGSTCE